MAADEPRTWDNLNVSEETPTDAMLAFMLACGFGLKGFEPQLTNRQVLVPQLNQNIAQIIFQAVLDDSAKTRQLAGRVTPSQSPRQTLRVPDAPKPPTRPTSLAVAQASGHTLATAVRTLFLDVPAGAPDV